MPEQLTPEQITEMQAENAKLKADLEAAKKPPEQKPDPKPEPELDLREKAIKEKKDLEDKSASTKEIESALKFEISLESFVKDNVDVLPSEIGDIVRIASKESFDSAVQKAGVIKTSILQSFFAVQANVDLLTTNQKSRLDDYLKLTKNGKEQKAKDIFEDIFEPALRLKKEILKAEELGKSKAGLGSSSKEEDEYKNKLINVSRKAHLGEKGI